MIDAEKFNRAITLWFELVGLDPNLKSYKWGQIDWVRASERLRDSMELDPSLLTTLFLLDAYSTSYFQQATISIAAFDADEDKVFDYMSKVREFKKLIGEGHIIQARDEFTERLRLALLSYGFEAAKIHEVLDKRDVIAYLRRDALLSADRMRADHFLQGDVDPIEVMPLLHKKVFSYWNINSMIDHLCGMPSGISLNLIRDPDELCSFFTIGIRNGANVIVLSDVPEYAHPLGRDMSRRPDRDFESRSGKNWFPYDLLTIAYDKKGNPYHDKYREAKDTGVTPHQPTFFPLTDIKDIDAKEAIWLTLMMDLLVERYWKNPIEPKALSYTGEMIRLEDQHQALISAAKSNLPVVDYQPLNLPVLTIADVKTGALGEDSIGKIRSNFGSKQWLEDRYGDMVTPEVLNLVAAPDAQVRFITHDGSFKPSSFGYGRDVVVADDIKKMPADQWKSFTFFNQGDVRYQVVKQMDATVFGTRESLDADRKFLARYNYVKSMQMEADKEFARREDEVKKWFEDRVRANADNLLSYASPEDVHHRMGANVAGFNPDALTTHLYIFASCEDLNNKDRYRFGYLIWAQVSLNSGYTRRGDYYSCYVNNTRASWRLLLMPRSPEDLALLAGVTVKELPDVLQHWTKCDPYTGNSILNRIDPLEWAIKNPWLKLNFIVGIHLSKRARTAIQKDAIAPADHVERQEGDRVYG